MTSLKNVVEDLSAKGRGGDSMIGHLSPKDLIIPKEMQTPEMIASLKKHYFDHGTSIDRYTAGHRENSINPETGQPEFGWFKKLWKPFRDTVESILPIVGDYFLPGSSLVTDKLVSKGAQKNLSSPLGQIAQAGTSLVGGGFGSETTGIPASSGYTGAGNTIGNLFGDPTLGTDISSGISNAAKGISSGVSDLFGNSTAADGAASGVTSPASAASSSSSGFNLSTPFADSVGSGATSGADSNLSWLNTSDATGSASSVSSPATAAASSNVGSGTVGTPNLSGGQSGGFYNYDLGGNPSGAGAVSPSVAATTPSSVQSFLDKPGVGSAWNVVKANPGAAINAAGLGLDAIRGQQPLKGERQLQQEAAGLASQGKTLQDYINSGALPPGLQQGINQASEAAKATIRSKFASMGMSGSSSEQQELAAVDQRAQAQGAEMAMQLLNTGINETGMASQLYQSILNESIANDKELGSAISSFASAASGGGGVSSGGHTINIT